MEANPDGEERAPVGIEVVESDGHFDSLSTDVIRREVEVLRHAAAHCNHSAAVDKRAEASGRVVGVVGSIAVAEQAVEIKSYHHCARVAECRHDVTIAEYHRVVAVVVRVLR